MHPSVKRALLFAFRLAYGGWVVWHTLPQVGVTLHPGYSSGPPFVVVGASFLLGGVGSIGVCGLCLFRPRYAITAAAVNDAFVVVLIAAGGVLGVVTTIGDPLPWWQLYEAWWEPLALGTFMFYPLLPLAAEGVVLVVARWSARVTSTGRWPPAIWR